MKNLFILSLALIFISSLIWAQVPLLLNYQGRLTNDAGSPIISATSVKFKLYQGGDATTPGSGRLVYEEDATVTPNNTGVFNHMIGSGTVIYGLLDVTAFNTAQPVYLEIAIDPVRANDTLFPRKRIVSVGYSFKSELTDNADTVNGQHASDFHPKSESDSSFVHTAGDDKNGTLNVDASTTYTLYGKSRSPNGYSIYGYNNDGGFGSYYYYGKFKVTGIFIATTKAPNGRGVYGEATATSGANYGVYGESKSTSGTGVYGYAESSSGTNYGVYGRSNSPNGYGIYGYCPTGGAGYAGYFSGNVHIAGNAHVAGTFTADAKECVQEIEGGKKVTLYAMESPEYWFEDFGTGQLENGQAVVQIERVFAQTVNTDMGYYVFLTPNGECNGLYISKKNRDCFEVQELGGGTSTITFDYRIVAKRRGYENLRLEEFTEPKESPEVPNLPIERKEAKVKQPQRR